MAIHLGAVANQRPAVLEALEKDGFVIHHVHGEKDWVSALRPHAGEIRGILSSGMAGFSKELIAALPKLEICALNGVGLETSDLAAAKERGVVVTTTPVLFEDVSDLAVVLAMSAARRIPHGDRFVRKGAWPAGRFTPGRSFWGKRYGILGLGRIGTALGRRLEGFGGQISYYDPLPKPATRYTRAASGLDLARNVDILFMCAAGGRSGVIVTREILEALGPKGSFVNIARGWLVDEPALVELLGAGKLGSAGLDVFFDEPNVPQGLMDLDNVVLTPHIASNTEECARAMGECLVANVQGWFKDGKAVTPVGGTPA